MAFAKSSDYDRYRNNRVVDVADLACPEIRLRKKEESRDENSTRYAHRRSACG